MADWRPPDPYEVLGIRQGASSAEISRAYRRLARELHPDSRPVHADAAGQFRAATDAYEQLCGPAMQHKAAQGRPARHRPVRPAPVVTPGTPDDETGSPMRAAGHAYQRRGGFTPSSLAAVRPGPVRIEPLPQSAPAPDEDPVAWLAELLQLIQQAQGRSYRTW